MKSKYSNYKPGVLLVLFALLIFSSCRDELSGAMETSSKLTVLKSIKIVNAGADGNITVEGTIDEDKKTISFPRIDPESNLAALRFEAVIVEGASLEQNVYDLALAEGASEKTITIKVLNAPRSREYFATIRLRVPVYGGDFTKAKFYDYSPNEAGNPIYPAFAGVTTRGTGFNGEYVFIVDRNAPHLLRVSDLKDYRIAPVPLNITGVAGGTFTLHSGALVKNHIYAANLSGGQTSPLKIYHWTDPAAQPAIIADLNIAGIPGAGVRHGDNMSVSLDDNGNGYIFFGDNAGTKILRLSVTNYTQVGDPSVISAPVSGAGSWISYNRVGGSDEYIYTGHDAPIYVLNASGSNSYNMTRASIPVRGSDARVFYFNGERYLLMLTAARTGSEPTVLYVYNITKGNTIADAIRIFETETEKKPVFEYSLLGAANGNPTTQTGFYVKRDSEGKDESLMLYGSSFAAGFVIVEVPKMELED